MTHIEGVIADAVTQVVDGPSLTRAAVTLGAYIGPLLSRTKVERVLSNATVGAGLPQECARPSILGGLEYAHEAFTGERTTAKELIQMLVVQAAMGRLGGTNLEEAAFRIGKHIGPLLERATVEMVLGKAAMAAGARMDEATSQIASGLQRAHREITGHSGMPGDLRKIVSQVQRIRPDNPDGLAILSQVAGSLGEHIGPLLDRGIVGETLFVAALWSGLPGDAATRTTIGDGLGRGIKARSGVGRGGISPR